ncbi:hypothetical protein AC1031_004648 [Aphanomyces cochlioides]|nr:hypothetical protein AC1031_004648 [Aphanomyces cochlioides]
MTKKAKRRRYDAKNSEPSAAFLAALEAQRAKETKQDEPTEASASSSRPKAIPGFYYDPAKGKYFPGKAPPQPSPALTQAAPSAAATKQAKPRSWTRHLIEREMFGRQPQDPRDLIQLIQTRSCRALWEINPYPFPPEPIAHVRTAANGDLAIALVDGTLYIVRPGIRWLEVVTETLPFIYPNVSHLRWHPQQSELLSCSAIGGANTSGFLRVVDSISLQARYTLDVPNAWTHAWSPRKSSQLALAATFLGNKTRDRRVHLVDIEMSKVMHGPATPSDVFAQCFCHQGNSILNGTRGGDLWLWDVRSRHPAAIQRCGSKASEKSSPSSISDVHALCNNMSILASTTNGAICQWDLRKSVLPVVEYAAPSSRRFPVRLAVDPSETMLAATTASTTVQLWSVRDGRMIAARDNGIEVVESIEWTSETCLRVGGRHGVMDYK